MPNEKVESPPAVPQDTLKKDPKKLVKDLGADQEAAYKARRALLRKINAATGPGMDARRAEMARLLASELNRKTEPKKDDKGKDVPRTLVHSAAVRGKVAALLGLVAGAAEVPALVEAVKDLEVREPARMALEQNPSREATKALLQAADEVGPTFRVGVINSLANRRDPDALSRLQELALSDPEDEVRLAAVEALAGFPDPGSDTAIVRASRVGPPAARARALRARIRLAETLARAGRKAAAAGIYRAVQAGPAGSAQKKAAERGLKKLA